MPAFEVAAGILLLLQSIELIFAHPGGLSALTTGEEREAELSGEIAVFPLAIPLIAGPASITAAMLLMGQAGADPLRVAVFFVALFIALALTYLMLMLVEPLGRLLGVTGTNVIARISGILLAALAVQFILRRNTREPSAQMKRHPLKSRDCYVSPAGRLGSFPRYRRRH